MNHILVPLIGCGNRCVPGAWLFVLPAAGNEGIQSNGAVFLSCFIHAAWKQDLLPASFARQIRQEEHFYKSKMS